MLRKLARANTQVSIERATHSEGFRFDNSAQAEANLRRRQLDLGKILSLRSDAQSQLK